MIRKKIKTSNVNEVNILILESNSKETELMRDLIREIGSAQIDSTESIERAVDLVSKVRYQLLIVAGSKEVFDPISILERVKQVTPETSVIILSSFPAIEEAIQSIKAGAEEYFPKPFHPEQFKLAVKKAINRREFYSGDKNISELMILLNSCQFISSSLSEDRLLEVVCGYIRRETAPKSFALFKVKGTQWSRVETSLDEEGEVVEVFLESLNLEENFHQNKEPLKVLPKTNVFPEVALFQFKGVCDSNYFAIAIEPNFKLAIERMHSYFRLMQVQIQLTAKTIESYQGVKDLLYVDEPTGLYNTRYLHLSLDRYFEDRSKGILNSLSILFIDLDKFKSVNDNHGHLVGTSLLNEIGKILKKSIRETDLAFRYGGDEFVVLLRNVNSDLALQTAERIRASVEKNVFRTEGSNEALKLTVSIGVANCPEHALTKKEIIEAADHAMYSVKRTSRNSVFIADQKKAA